MSEEASRRRLFGKTIISIFTSVMTCLIALDMASAAQRFSCTPQDQNGVSLPYDGPFICGHINKFRNDCEALRKLRGVPVLNTGHCFNFAAEEAILDDNDRDGGH